MAREAPGALSSLEDRAHGVELTLPADPELFSLARLTVSTVAARLDFTIEDIEDLRLAVDELCTICAKGAGAGSRLRLCLASDARTLRVECSVNGVTEIPGERGELLAGMTADELSLRILSELVDAYTLSPLSDGIREGSIEKRRATPDAGN